MDRQQFLDQIAAIDLQIGHLKERNRPIARAIALGHAGQISEDDQQQCARDNEEVRRLAEQKRVLRIQLSES
jgi:hypothetical protein